METTTRAPSCWTSTLTSTTSPTFRSCGSSTEESSTTSCPSITSECSPTTSIVPVISLVPRSTSVLGSELAPQPAAMPETSSTSTSKLPNRTEKWRMIKAPSSKYEQDCSIDKSPHFTKSN